MRTIEAEPAKPAPTSNSALRDWIRRARGHGSGRRPSGAAALSRGRGTCRGAGRCGRADRGRRRRAPDLSGTDRARQSVCGLGARPWARQGRHGLPDDAEPPRVSGDLARAVQRRDYRCADQYRAAWTFARALHRYRDAEACDHRRRMRRAISERQRPADESAEGVATWRGRWRLRAYRPRDRTALAGPADAAPTPSGDDRRSRAADLHLAAARC
jgi:hypothetical protein